MTWLDRLLAEGPGLVLPGAQEGAQGAHAVFDPTLEALCAGLPLEDAQALREERAAILEYEAGMTREDAERFSTWTR